MKPLASSMPACRPLLKMCMTAVHMQCTNHPQCQNAEKAAESNGWYERSFEDLCPKQLHKTTLLECMIASFRLDTITGEVMEPCASLPAGPRVCMSPPTTIMIDSCRDYCCAAQVMLLQRRCHVKREHGPAQCSICMPWWAVARKGRLLLSGSAQRRPYLLGHGAAQDHGADDLRRDALKQVGPSCGAVPDVVAHQICNHCRIPAGHGLCTECVHFIPPCKQSVSATGSSCSLALPRGIQLWLHHHHSLQHPSLSCTM